jgi:PPOX class probable F420-dependent enzyme
MPLEPLLSASQRAFLASARRAVLATIATDGRARLVPICFVLIGDGPTTIYTPIDDKPKRSGDPFALARVRDIAADPRVTVIVDRWDEDWTRLAWLRVEGQATVLDGASPSADHESAVAALRAKYPQYTTHRLDTRPLIRVTVERVIGWGPPEASAG